MGQKSRRRNEMGTRSNQMKSLETLREEPSSEAFEDSAKKYTSWGVLLDWLKGQMEKSVTNRGHGNKSSGQCSDLKLLVGVLGCPLGPVSVVNDPLPHLSIKDVPFEASSAQYIVQQYMAATGCIKFQNSIKSSYMAGRVKMVSTECEIAAKVSRSNKATENGCFVLWQMMPDMWSMELVLGESKVHAGSNGKIVWRHTPWLGSHAAKGPARPLRRALQGLDPRTTAIMFANARCVGEKKIGDEDCFILKLSADPSILQERSDGPAEIIRHVLFGYFSQKTGLLVYMEDSHLTRIQATGISTVYWETTIETTINDYQAVDGVMIAHSGRSIVTLFKFGEIAMDHTKTRMEETWTIDDVVFNVPGLSMDCFIPPADVIGNGSAGDSCNYESDGKLKVVKHGNGTSQDQPTGKSKCLDQLTC
ncbi:hypothetical protein SUGI_1145340 [Cryptomeria japonica]|uniref:uncharacterized protein LOC131069678 n=1 Tax=Cryptomeria japonica TaxID=3369 RepID=UPI002414BF65|nr:uncharacterized protein LOC131069678 [Cryptomeria japonica]GLJ53686.1 hypothetical protein SUGI_1145340 [Cryptomeria japonica]